MDMIYLNIFSCMQLAAVTCMVLWATPVIRWLASAAAAVTLWVSPVINVEKTSTTIPCVRVRWHISSHFYLLKYTIFFTKLHSFEIRKNWKLVNIQTIILSDTHQMLAAIMGIFFPLIRVYSGLHETFWS